MVINTYLHNKAVIIALLFLVPPIGVYLLWAYTDWNKVLKQVLSALFLIWFLAAIVFSVIHFYDSAKQMDYIPEGAIVTEVRGSWGLYKDEELVDRYSGIAENEHGKWVIEKGLVDFDYTGEYKYDGQSYYVVEGKVSPS